MQWSDERYVRLYTADTVDWEMWPWESRALFPLVLRKVDRAGVLDMGRHGERGLAAMLRLPEPVVSAGLAGLLEDGCVVMSGTRLVVRNFIEAQEATQSDKARKRAERERSRARAITPDEPVTFRDDQSRTVTKSHEESRAVTPSHTRSLCAELSLAEPSLAVGDAVPPEPPPPSASAVRTKAPRAKAKTSCPGSDAPIDELSSWSDRWKVDMAHREFAQFIDHHRANGSLFADWGAAWRNWLKPKPWMQRADARAVQKADDASPWGQALEWK